MLAKRRRRWSNIKTPLCRTQSGVPISTYVCPGLCGWYNVDALKCQCRGHWYSIGPTLGEHSVFADSLGTVKRFHGCKHCKSHTSPLSVHQAMVVILWPQMWKKLCETQKPWPAMFSPSNLYNEVWKRVTYMTSFSLSSHSIGFPVTSMHFTEYPYNLIIYVKIYLIYY